MADFAAIFERLKSNKLAIPAILVGVVAGGYVLIKQGGLSGGGSSLADQTYRDAIDAAGQGSPDAGGGGNGGGGDIAALQEEQRSFMQSIVDRFNELATSVANIGGEVRPQQFPEMDRIGGEVMPQQFPEIGQQVAEALAPLGGLVPDLSNLYQQPDFQPPTLSQYRSPGLKLGGVGFSGITKAVTPSKPKQIIPVAAPKPTGLSLFRSVARPRTPPRDVSQTSALQRFRSAAVQRKPSQQPVFRQPKPRKVIVRRPSQQPVFKSITRKPSQQPVFRPSFNRPGLSFRGTSYRPSSQPQTKKITRTVRSTRNTITRNIR